MQSINTTCRSYSFRPAKCQLRHQYHVIQLSQVPHQQHCQPATCCRHVTSCDFCCATLCGTRLFCVLLASPITQCFQVPPQLPTLRSIYYPNMSRYTFIKTIKIQAFTFSLRGVLKHIIAQVVRANHRLFFFFDGKILNFHSELCKANTS